jgi:carboxylesterase type B
MDDLLYLFPQNQMLPNLKLTPEDEDMIETMTSLWVNFAHTGYVRLCSIFQGKTDTLRERTIMTFTATS